MQPFGSSADGFRKPHVELINKTSVKVEAERCGELSVFFDTSHQRKNPWYILTTLFFWHTSISTTYGCM